MSRPLQAVARGGARIASQVLDCSAQSDSRGAAQVIGRDAHVAARGGARCVSLILIRGAKADVLGSARG